MSNNSFDVAIVGAGNAALCGAITAASKGATTVVLEAAPEGKHGGNSWFTDGAIRFAHDGLEHVRPLLGEFSDDEAALVDLPPYPEADFRADLNRMSDGQTRGQLADILVERSYDGVRWLNEQGVPFALLYANQSFKVDGRYRFWGGLNVKVEGQGITLVDRLLERCAELDIEVRYGARVTAIEQGPIGHGYTLVTAAAPNQAQPPATVVARSVVLACGSMEANRALRVEALGPEWEHAIVRGSEFNQGAGINMARALGAEVLGEASGCHAVAMDAGAPAVGDHSYPGDIWKRHSYPLGLVVNREGQRFVDEGADYRNYTYARYGRELLNQPGAMAFQIFDQKTVPLLRDEYRRPEATSIQAATLAGLAGAMEVDVDRFVGTVTSFNEAVQDGRFNPGVLDGKGTVGVTPPKSNWAQRVDEPPFVAYPVVCGITFAYAGVRVDEQARVLRPDGSPIEGLHAAGEMVGGLFHGNYPGGSGLMSGTVFGRIAGDTAATAALEG